MDLLAAVLLLAVQDDLAVYPPAEKPGTWLNAQLLQECRPFFEARRAAVAALKTPDDLQRRQAELRRRFLEAIGPLPERTPLNAKVVGTLRRDGYRIEKVVYESRPNHHVTATLYLPDGKGPFPGILVPCGHSDNGKAAEAYQRASILFAKSGCAALCYDPIGQGERKQLLGSDGKAAVRGSTTEHTMAGLGAMLSGGTCAAFRIWDGFRSLDYLESRPEIDPKRLGCAGNSGGGTMTAYLMALDDRIQAAAPSCYITSLERLFETIGPQDAEQNIPGQVAFGMEHADYVTMRAPKATLINVGTQDFFDIHGARSTFKEAKAVYALLGAADRVDFFEFDDKHGWSRPRRESAARFMRKWLLGQDGPVAEPEFPVLSDAEIQVTETGQVLTAFRGVSVFDLNAARAEALAHTRTTSDLPGAVRRLLALRVPERNVQATVLGSFVRDGVTVEKRELGGRDGSRMPMLVYTPSTSKGRPVVYVHADGKSAAAGAALALAKEGRQVIVPDLPGWGELAPTAKSPFGTDWKEAFLAFHLGRTLAGRRVGELMALIRTLEAPQGVHVVGVGHAAPVALHAAVVDPRIAELTLEGGLLSYTEAARTPQSDLPASGVVPGVLQAYDLPDLLAAVAPRPLTLRRPVDARGQPATRDAVEAACARAKAAYASADAGISLIVER
ncbi:MAG TPA: acetylxylan esterase [Planctomycetota bacterium]|nr:acetylxylan esterase [Planctomycetota bacterium]